MKRFLLLAALSATLPGTTSAQDPTRAEEIRTEVMQWILGKAGDRPVAMGVKTGLLNSAESHTLAQIAIDPDKDYLLLGACNDQCWDLDLEAMDAEGHPLDLSKDSEVAVRFAIEEEPVLLLKAGRAGNALGVKVIMSDCQDDPCLWGVGVFEAMETD